jgi:hypothetical protein
MAVVRFNSTTGGNWNSTASWSATDGGAGPASVPVAGDTVNITANGGNIAVNVSSACGDFTKTGATLSGSAALAIGGSSSFGGTITYTGTITYNATTTGKTVAHNGKTLGSNVIINGIGGGWTQTDASATSGTFTVTNGAFSDGGFSLTASAFSSNNANARTIIKSGNWTFTGSGTVIQFGTSFQASLTTTFDPTKSWTLTNSGSTATTVNFGQLVSLGNLKVTAGSYSLTIGGAGNSSKGSLCDLDFSGFAGTWVGGNFTTATGNVTLGASMTVDTSTVGLTVIPTSTVSLTSNGVRLDRPLTVNGTGTLVLADNFDLGTHILTHTAGGLDFNNASVVSADRFNSSNTNVRSLWLRAAIISLSGGGASPTSGNGAPWNTSTTTNMTFDRGTATIKTTYSGGNKRDINTGGLPMPKLWLSGSGAIWVGPDNAVTSIDELKVDAGIQVNFPINGVITINKLTNGGSSGSHVKFVCDTPGIQYEIINATGAVIATDFLDAQDMIGAPGYSWFMGAHSVNGGANVGVAFCTPANASLMQLAA